MCGTGVSEKAADVRPKPKSWEETDGTSDRHGAWGLTGTAGKVVAMIGVALLITITPVFALYVPIIHITFGGSVMDFIKFAQSEGLGAVAGLVPLPSLEAWTYLGVFGVYEAFLQLALPGHTVYGPTSPKGNIPVYKANGVLALVTTIITILTSWRLGVFNPARVYELYLEIMVGLVMFGFALCAFMTYKGLNFPSSTDSGSTGYLIYDFYWGTELYPRLGKHFDIKVWTNCRIGMMLWAVLPLCYAAHQYQTQGLLADSMIVNVLLTEAYVFKFFTWESGYWRTMDIAHDRAGFYLCWGCLCWVPSVYTSPSLYLAAQPYLLGNWVAAAILLCGIACVFINYDADRQRQQFRASNGKCLVWGRPPRMIEAKYKAGGELRTSLLLASGWWGVSRHFHYVPEILAAVCWTLPGGFNHLLPWFYVIFLTLLLADRAYRDDDRCRSKYASYWEQYCELVPYKIIPFVF